MAEKNSASVISRGFFGPFGLRAGWRLLTFNAIISFFGSQQISPHFYQFSPVDILERAYHRKNSEVKSLLKTHNFKKGALNVVSRQKIAEKLKEIIIKKINLGSTEYKGLIRDYRNLYRSNFEQDLELCLMMDKIREIQELRYLPEKKMRVFYRSI